MKQFKQFIDEGTLTEAEEMPKQTQSVVSRLLNALAIEDVSSNQMKFYMTSKVDLLKRRDPFSSICKSFTAAISTAKATDGTVIKVEYDWKFADGGHNGYTVRLGVNDEGKVVSGADSVDVRF